MNGRGYIYLRRENDHTFALQVSQEPPPPTEQIECCVQVSDVRALYESLETDMGKKWRPVQGSNVFEGNASDLCNHMLHTLEEIKERELRRKDEEELFQIVQWILET